MADAVLQHYDLGPVLNTNSFVEAMQGSIAAEQHRKDEAQREKERKDALSARNSEYLQRQYSADKYKGTLHDGDYATEIGAIRDEAEKQNMSGVPMPQIQSNMSKRVADLDARYKAEGSIKSQIDANLERFKGVPGINQEALRAHTYGMAFRKYDPATGQYGDNKPTDQLDGKTDWVQAAIDAQPKDISNLGGLDAAVAKFNRSRDDLKTGGTINIDGREYNNGYTAKMSKWQKFSAERNKYGNPTGIEVGGEIVPAVDPETGKQIQDEHGEPMKVVPDQVYRNFINEPGTLPALRAATMREFEATGKPMPGKNDPKWELWQKHELYKYLQANSGSEYHEVNDETTQSKELRMRNDPRYLNSIRAGAAARMDGTLDSKMDHGIDVTKSSKEPATTVAGGVSSVYQGKYDAPIVDYNGKKYEDITGAFPKGSLKYGKSDKETYSQVLFDPTTNKIKTVYVGPDGKDVEKDWTEDQMGQFVGAHSEANGGSIAQNRKVLQTNGFSNGSFATRRGDKGENVIKATKEANDKKVDDAIDGEDYSSLKGTATPDGEVTAVNARNAVQRVAMDAFSIDITKDKKTTTKTFKTKAALAEYLKGGSKPKSGAILD